MNKKYKLTDESINFKNRKLYRIIALKDFSDVKKDDLGGYVENEYNLSQEGDCWIYDNAKVFDNAEVYDNAEVACNAEVYDYAEVYDNAKIFDDAKVYGEVKVYDNTKVYGNAIVYDHAEISGHAKVYNNAIISDNAEVSGYAQVFGYAKVYDYAEIYDYAVVYGNVQVCEDAKIFGDAKIYGNALINRNYKITGKVIDRFDDILEIRNPKGRLVTVILRDGKIYYNIGCQDEITEEIFKWRIENEDGGLKRNPYRKYYYKIIEIANSYFKDKIKSYKNNSRRQK